RGRAVGGGDVGELDRERPRRLARARGRLAAAARERGGDDVGLLIEVLDVLRRADGEGLPVDEVDRLRDLGAHDAVRRVRHAADDVGAPGADGDGAGDGAVGGGLEILDDLGRGRGGERVADDTAGDAGGRVIE